MTGFNNPELLRLSPVYPVFINRVINNRNNLLISELHRKNVI
jgi:hypothetical protein